MLENFIEIFRSGEQTDSAGNTKTWTDAECAQFAANHNNAAIRLGHSDDTGYGKIKNAKYENGVVLAEFGDVSNTFESILKSGEIVNRSIKLKKINDEWAIDHVAFLGHSAPAVAGLAPMFSASDSGEADYYEFALASNLDIDMWGYRSGMASVARLFRNLREFIIDKYDAQTAEPFSNYDIKNITDARTAIKNKDSQEFSQQQQQTGDIMPDQTITDQPSFSKDEMNQAVADAKKEASAEFALKEKAAQAAQAVKDNAAEIKGLVETGKITPAQAHGMPEFMAQLDAESYTFSQGAGDDGSTNAKKWFSKFVGDLNCGVIGGGIGDDGEAADKEISSVEIAEFSKKHGVSPVEAAERIKETGGTK